MNPKPSSACIGDDVEQCLCSTVQELRRGFADDDRDRADHLLRVFPDATRIVEALRVLVDALFPGRCFPADLVGDELGVFFMRRLSTAWRLLRPEVERALPFRWTGASGVAEHARPQPDVRAEANRIVREFLAVLPGVRRQLVLDVEAAYTGDPAALSYAEVQLAYPGVLAITSHRLAHELYLREVPIVPRVMSEWTHAQTGIDIHPGARIGPAFFIDHGTGVVIGETARIGAHVKIYQGVTLGAKSFPLDADGHPIKHIQRHPTVEDEVVIYSNATILGGDTVIGRGSTIGGNVFLTHSVPANSLVTAEYARSRIKTTLPPGSPFVPDYEI
jgi:serine O-acetyltransferase